MPAGTPPFGVVILVKCFWQQQDMHVAAETYIRAYLQTLWQERRDNHRAG